MTKAFEVYLLILTCIYFPQLFQLLFLLNFQLNAKSCNQVLRLGIS